MKSRAHWVWPAIVVGLLVLGAGANIGLLIVATHDPSFAVEPDYYEKAVHWDDKRAQDAVNLALGWRAEVEAEPVLDRGRPAARVVVHLADREGRPVEGAAVTLETFHLARAADVLHGSLRAGAAGDYEVVLPLRRAGLWEFRLDVVRGDAHFTATETREVATPWPRS